MMKLTYALCFLICIANSAAATTKAWLIGSEKSFKLNTANNTIEQEISASLNVRKVFFDSRTGNVFVLYSPRRYQGEIAVCDVKTLTRTSKLDIVIDLVTEDDVQLIFPLTGNQLFLRWVKEEDGDPEIVVYDATTLKPLNRFTTLPPISDKLSLSEAGDILYSIEDDEDALKINNFETSKFTFKSSVDLKKFFGANVTGYSMQDYKNQKFLVSETSSLGSLKYVYDIATNTVSKKISMSGESYLLPKTNRIINMEERYVGKFKSMSLSTDYIFTGKIIVFDAISGSQVGGIQITLDANTMSDIVGVSPLEDKLYVRTYSASGSGVSKLLIFDMNNYALSKELTLPESSMKMIFFEE